MGQLIGLASVGVTTHKKLVIQKEKSLNCKGKNI